MKRNILILSALLALPLMASNLQWQMVTVVSYFETIETAGYRGVEYGGVVNLKPVLQTIQHLTIATSYCTYTAYFTVPDYSGKFVNLSLNDPVRFAEKGDHWWQLIVIDRDGHKRQLRAPETKRCQQGR